MDLSALNLSMPLAQSSCPVTHCDEGVSMATSPECELLTPPQAARVLGIGKNKIGILINRGDIRATDMSLGTSPRWKIRRTDLDAFIESRMNAPKPKPARRRRGDDSELEFIK